MLDVYLFSSISGFILFIVLFMFLLWGLAANRVGRLPFRSTRGELRKSARRSLVLLWLALISSLLFAGLAVLTLVRFGRVFIQEWAVFVLPTVLLTHWAVILFTLPRLRRWARDREDPTSPVGGEDRGAIAAPRVAVPVQTAFVAAGLATLQIWFVPVLTLFPIRLALFWGVFLGLGCLLWFRQRRRSRILRREVTSRSLGFRLMRATVVTAGVVAGGLVWFVMAMQASELPDRMSMMNHKQIDYGGGPAIGHGSDGGSDHAHAAQGEKTVSVTELAGPRTGEPDRRYTLVARKEKVRLSSGKTIEAWTFNGQVPGPELRARKGELVEVTLINEDIEDGVTIHWHGVDVPNAEDGVAGLTQNSVKPGERHTYRFRVEETGTHWYHSHQTSSIQVRKGLFGPLVLLPEEEPEKELDLSLTYHSFGDRSVLNESDTLRRQRVVPGTKVRLRLINTDIFPRSFTLVGTPFQVAAIDGNDVHRPTPLKNVLLLVAAGGRYDVTFTMPEQPVRLTAGAGADDPGILLSPDGKGEAPAIPGNLPLFDPASYGELKPIPFDPSDGFDREFTMVFDVGLGFYNGMFRDLWLINGEVFPDTPTFMVRKGDLVKTTFINRSPMDHPMHLHGHHMLVLSKNGKPVSGSPWWTDTLNVAPGETYEVAFRADNPGIWMDHCHNLDHASAGMTLHLSYEGVTTPFHVGEATGNHPE